MTELKPCPFCGSEVYFDPSDNSINCPECNIEFKIASDDDVLSNYLCDKWQCRVATKEAQS